MTLKETYKREGFKYISLLGRIPNVERPLKRKTSYLDKYMRGELRLGEKRGGGTNEGRRVNFVKATSVTGGSGEMRGGETLPNLISDEDMNELFDMEEGIKRLVVKGNEREGKTKWGGKDFDTPAAVPGRGKTMATNKFKMLGRRLESAKNILGPGREENKDKPAGMATRSRRVTGGAAYSAKK